MDPLPFPCSPYSTQGRAIHQKSYISHHIFSCTRLKWWPKMMGSCNRCWGQPLTDDSILTKCSHGHDGRGEKGLLDGAPALSSLQTGSRRRLTNECMAAGCVSWEIWAVCRCSREPGMIGSCLDSTLSAEATCRLFKATYGWVPWVFAWWHIDAVPPFPIPFHLTWHNDCAFKVQTVNLNLTVVSDGLVALLKEIQSCIDLLALKVPHVWC